MEHEPFPVAAFGFMDEPASEDQKKIIVELAQRAGTPIDPNGKWPERFSRWDAKRMIDVLREQLREPID